MKFTIGRRIWFGFLLLILLNLIVFYLTDKSIKESKIINEKQTTVIAPSVKLLEDFKLRVEQSRILINYWANVESKSEVQEKKDLVNIIDNQLPKLRNEILVLAEKWSVEDKNTFISSYEKVEELNQYYAEVMAYLPNFSSYQSATNLFLAKDLTDPGGIINENVDAINQLVGGLASKQRQQSGKLLNGMNENFDKMKFITNVLGLIMIGAGIIIALLTARSIVRPILQVKDKLISLSQGVIPIPETSFPNDEIGEMKLAMNQLISGQTRVREFVSALGSGDFEIHYEPLSATDEMAPDFIKTRDDLAENERITERKIVERTQELEEKTNQLAEKNAIVTELYQDLKDSITYAKRLQDSILPTDDIIHNVMGESFIYFNPKEIVSGDFYWTKDLGRYKAFAAIDCTGHGVPGAFMSLIGYNSLNRAVSDVESADPGLILDRMNELATKALYRNKGEYEVRDGMDMALCVFDSEKKVMYFAGAGRPFIYVRNGEIFKVKGCRQAIGGATPDSPKFVTHTINMEKGDMIYIFSDGYADQYGGDNENPKKYKVGKFYRFLEELSTKQLYVQKDMMEKELLDWMGETPQIDDIIVIGARIE